MLTLTIQLKEDYANKEVPPEETAYWLPCLQASALAIEQLNELFKDQLIHGPLKSNAASETIEGFLGDVNTIPNEMGVVSIIINDYNSLKIPYLPPEVPFILYLGDTSEQKQIGVDEKGNPVYETIYAGSFI